jgi:Domain of unknown function (DUF397)
VRREPELTHVHWRKSSHSTGQNECVEAAQIGAAVAVRDSKDPRGGHVSFDAAAWRALLDRIKRGHYAV